MEAKKSLQSLQQWGLKPVGGVVSRTAQWRDVLLDDGRLTEGVSNSRTK